MRMAMMVGGVAATLVFTGAGPARAARTCTWGGTPDAPTGVTSNDPGLTDLPAAAPLSFRATGALGGGCAGRFTFTGVMDAVSPAGLVSFHGTARGLPGVARSAGVSIAGIAPARLYDRAGNVVGSENAQFLTNAPFSECMTPEGLERNNFSSVIVLF